MVVGHSWELSALHFGRSAGATCRSTPAYAPSLSHATLLLAPEAARYPTKTNCKDDALFPRPSCLDLVAGTVTIGMQADEVRGWCEPGAFLRAFGSSGLPHIADGWCRRCLRLRPNEGAT